MYQRSLVSRLGHTPDVRRPFHLQHSRRGDFSQLPDTPGRGHSQADDEYENDSFVATSEEGESSCPVDLLLPHLSRCRI